LSFISGKEQIYLSSNTHCQSNEDKEFKLSGLLQSFSNTINAQGFSIIGLNW